MDVKFPPTPLGNKPHDRYMHINICLAPKAARLVSAGSAGTAELLIARVLKIHTNEHVGSGSHLGRARFHCAEQAHQSLRTEMELVRKRDGVPSFEARKSRLGPLPDGVLYLAGPLQC